MSDLVVLERIELVPVVELEPSAYATRERPLPAWSGREEPAAWGRYWRASLADSGLVGLEPLGPGSWLVPVRQLRCPDLLGRVLAPRWGEGGLAGALADPDALPVLDGGLALF